MCVYLDTAATAPIDSRVLAAFLAATDGSVGNSGSRTHGFGRKARTLVERARHHVGAVVGANRADVVFTSGATEANNLALLGLAGHGARANRRHIVSTAIEHHAVHEPLRTLARQGFEITLVPPARTGAVVPADVMAALRPDTLLVSVMHVNNETGAIQPIAEIAHGLAAADVYFHVDAAQGYGKVIEPLRDPRIDLISVSGHKIGAPQGIGALIVRRRNGGRPPLDPLLYGGGQERGLRPGTLPVALIAAFGRAAELALTEHPERVARCRAFRAAVLDGLAPLAPVMHGDPHITVPHILNMSFPGLDAESVIEAWSDLVAISNGAACTSAHYTCSHVLSAMELPAAHIAGAVRLSWQHDTPAAPIGRMADALDALKARPVAS